MTSRETNIAYATQCINRYGNVYISENTFNQWEQHELEEYLSTLTERPISIRKCHIMDSGVVAEINRSKEKKYEAFNTYTHNGR